MSAQQLRVAAYGVCRRDDQILLARWVSPDGVQRLWTLPGGRIEHAEAPRDAVVREVAEETGYRVEVERLLGIGSHTHEADWVPGGAEMHRLSVFYRVQITGGTLRNELDGSTDIAAWIPMADVPGLKRAVVVETALKLEDARPLDGHVDPVPAGGLLHP